MNMTLPLIHFQLKSNLLGVFFEGYEHLINFLVQSKYFSLVFVSKPLGSIQAQFFLFNLTVFNSFNTAYISILNIHLYNFISLIPIFSCVLSSTCSFNFVYFWVITLENPIILWRHLMLSLHGGDFGYTRLAHYV